MSDYYNALPILSYNGIINFILTNRNYGKTWAFKIRAWRRAYKYGKKTIWVRRFDNEAKSAAQTFYRSKDLQRMLRGYTPYDPKTKKGNVKQDGTTFYIKRNGTWDWFLKIVKLSDSTAMRSADDVKVDTIVFDEFTTTPDKYTFAHTGDQYDKNDMEWIAKIKDNAPKIDALTINCWSYQIADAIKGFNPRYVVTGHENEMGHTIDHREAFWLTFQKMEPVEHDYVVMAWGEWFSFK